MVYLEAEVTVELEVVEVDGPVPSMSELCSGITTSCTLEISRGVYNVTINQTNDIDSTVFVREIDCE